MSSVEVRFARNEVLFRSINEHIRELGGRFERVDDGPTSFVCECSDETCVERIRLTISQYDELRALPVRFVVTPGHEATPLVEQVLFRSAAFSIVRKVGIAADVVREMSEPE